MGERNQENYRFDSASVGIGVNQGQVHGARAAEDQQALNHGGDLKKKGGEEKKKKNSIT